MGKRKDDIIPTRILDNEGNLLSHMLNPPNTHTHGSAHPLSSLRYIGELYCALLEQLTHGSVP